MIEVHKIEDEVTQLMPTTQWPGEAIEGYDLSLAALLAPLCEMTPVDLILSTHRRFEEVSE